MEKEVILLHKTNILLIIIIFFIGYAANAQNNLGCPLITNYHPSEYKGYSQNWDMCSNSKGILFFANGDGVIIYDGHSWQKKLLTKSVPASALYCDKNDVIWVGGQSELGALIPDKTNGYSYVSLKNLISEKYRNFNFITQIIESSDGIYFRSGMLLFRYHKGKIFCQPIESSSCIFKLYDKALIFSRNQGFSIIAGNKLLKVKSTFQESLTLRSMLPMKNDTFLFVDQNKGLFTTVFNFSNKLHPTAVVEPFNNSANSFLINNGAYSATKLLNGNYAFATIRSGTIITDSQFNIIYILNKNCGVMNESHTSLFEDLQHNLWITLDNGICKVNLSIPLTCYNDNSGIRGSVLDVCRFSDKLLIATWQGVFYENTDKKGADEKLFKLLGNINSQSWKFEKITFNNQTYVLLVGSDGIYVIDKHFNYQKILPGNFNYVEFDDQKNYIYVASQFDVKLVKIKSSFNDLQIFNIPKIYSHITSLALDVSNRLVVGTTLNGVYIVNPIELKKSKKTDFQIYQYAPGKQLENSDAYYVYNYEGQVLVLTRNGIYKLLENNKLSSTYFDYTFKPYFNNFQFISIIRSNDNGDIWFQVKSKLSGEKKVLLAKKNKAHFSIIDKPFKLFPNIDFYNIYCEKNGTIWLCGDDGIFRYKYSNIINKTQYPFSTILKSVTVGDSIVYSGLFSDSIREIGNFNDLLVLNRSYQNIRFDFSSNFYTDEKMMKYSHYLEGIDKSWSSPSNDNYKEYTKLPSGKYTFHVRAINPYGDYSNEIDFHFEILSPWYTTWWGFIMFSIAAMAFVSLIIFIVNRRLIRAKTRLESIIHRRTMEINNQKRAIEIEKEKADQLLLNILPVRIAEELKNLGQCQTEFYDSVTVLFTDFSNFTSISEKANPAKLISKLDEMFIRFDEICSRHKMEKIKTIGDSHMSVGGIPVRNRTHPIDAVLAAMEMQQYMAFMQSQNEENKIWKLRIGVNTGEIISGVVGKRKFAFDVWGDTVNTASRFQDAGECGKVNISKSTAEAVKDFFNLQYRGIIPIKHKGEVDMFFVTSIKKELSIDALGEKPNSAFWEKYNNFIDLKYLDF